MLCNAHLIYRLRYCNRLLDGFSYDPDTNRIEYHFTDDPWEDRDVVRYDGSEDGDSEVSVSVIESKPVSEDRDLARVSGNDGGSGKKDCTSCNGGYIIEYESGQYMGNGPTTREVRKDCPVCTGGQVTCYH